MDIPENVQADYPLSRLTTVRAGGSAELFARPASEAELIGLLRWARDHDHQVEVVGSGSRVHVGTPRSPSAPSDQRGAAASATGITARTEGLATPEEGSEIADDYGSVGLSLRRHPLAIIRPKLAEWGIKTSEDLRVRAKDRQTVRASGM